MARYMARWPVIGGAGLVGAEVHETKGLDSQQETQEINTC